MASLVVGAEEDRGSQVAMLQKLHARRERKRNEGSALFQRKRDLREQMEKLEAEMKQVEEASIKLRSVLFDMDDKIAELEEHLGTTAGEVAAGSGVQPHQVPAGDLDSDNDTPPGSQAMPLTMHPEEILPDPSMTQLTQAGDILTDPLTSTQSLATAPFTANTRASRGPIELLEDDDDDDDDRPSVARVSTSSYFSNAASRPQLVLQPVNHNTNAGPGTSNQYRGSHQPSDHLRKPAPTPSSSSPFPASRFHQVLNQTFRIQNFRENQLAIIQATLAQEDCFVIMRTGGGKSLLYQLPVVLERPKITLVISPLLSLMQDQQDQINDFCPKVCVSFHSGLSKTEQAENWRRVRDPTQNVGMILVTPERVYKSNLLKSELQNLYSNNRFARIVIDECHCCCQWGHDFRPDYAKLGVLRSTFPRVPILAVTATASDRVREDCGRILKLNPNYRFFRSSANRPNLTYSIKRKDGSATDTLDDMVEWIQSNHKNEAGIVYTRTRKEADTVAKQLKERGIGASAYYSDVAPAKKEKIHKSWMKNKTQVVVATIAFGLGINKPDVRFVIHHSMSKTLEAYYQESGRAGRDGNPADCVLYYSPKDVAKLISMTHGDQSSQLMWTMIKYAQHFGSDAVCRAILLQNLGGEPNHDMETVLKQHDATVAPRDILSHSQTLLQLLFTIQDEKVTMAMLVKEWRTKPENAHDCVKQNPPFKDLTVFECEYIVVALMLNELIAVDVQYTAYDVVVYLRCTDRAEQFLTSPRAQMTIRLPPAEAKKAKNQASRKAVTDDVGWIQTKKPAAKRKRTASASTTTSKGKRAKSTKKAPASKAAATARAKKKAPKAKATTASSSKAAKSAKQRSIDDFATASGASRTASNQPPLGAEIIDIDDDDDDDSAGADDTRALDDLMVDSDEDYKFEERANGTRGAACLDDLMVDSDEEYEFEG